MIFIYCLNVLQSILIEYLKPPKVAYGETGSIEV